MSALRVVLGDQLSRDLSALAGYAEGDVVLMAEVMGECTYAPHHPQKIVLVLAAMRHFAKALRGRGVAVRYVALDDPDNTQSLDGEVARAVAALGAERVICTHPGEYRVLEMMRGWPGVEIREDTRFCASLAGFRAWAAPRRELRLEFFYRDMRRKYRILLDAEGQPEGGRWNFDPQNRKAPPKGQKIPPPKRFSPDAATRELIELVKARFPGHYGDADGFAWPVTARDAQAGFDAFLRQRLAQFGDWQDAMARGEAFMFHALVSVPLNLGLLAPLDLCRAAEAEYRAGRAKLNAVEGFIRQILGWREFVRGVYWLHMPDYARLNALEAKRPLPDFYWTGATKMACVAAVVKQTMAHAYAHHIQRLMVTGNFALLAGLDPDAVDAWYLSVYADAYEWVEMPNTRGMALHADGGIVGSKPYAASGAYINRMSDYCRGCAYDVKASETEDACPFNALYWDFLARHAARFANNPRMALAVRNWQDKKTPQQQALRARAEAVFAALATGTL